VLGCVTGTPLGCDDGIACTLDACDPASGCTHLANDAVCQDDAPCNGEETCDGQVGCVAGTPKSCPSDGLACTLESCESATDQCASVLQPDHCLIADTCHAAGDVSGSNACLACAPQVGSSN
jgi:hypothetical protein